MWVGWWGGVGWGAECGRGFGLPGPVPLDKAFTVNTTQTASISIASRVPYLQHASRPFARPSSVSVPPSSLARSLAPSCAPTCVGVCVGYVRVRVRMHARVCLGVFVSVRVAVCVSVRVPVCLCLCVRAHARTCMCTHARRSPPTARAQAAHTSAAPRMPHEQLCPCVQELARM